MRRKAQPIGTHYAAGRRLCSRCRHRYTALGVCPDCQRQHYANLRAAGALNPVTPKGKRR